MKALAFSVLVCGACLDQSKPAGEPDHTRVTLPSDAWFGGAGGAYATVDDCIAAQDPNSTIGIWPCSFELVLCHNGNAGMLHGDVVTEGTYSMDLSLAKIDVGENSYPEHLVVDVQTGLTTDSGSYAGMHWSPDIDHRWAHLEQFGFDCN